jgi:carbonic anhydrase
MSKILDEIRSANEAYTEEFGDLIKLALPPARRFAILTCMDARLDPPKFAGWREGDAHVIRNAGGRASHHAIRSLAISHKLLGTQECFGIHHTDCGMLTFTNDVMRDSLAKSLETSGIESGSWVDSGAGSGSDASQYREWLTIRDLAKSVLTDVTRIRMHPPVPSRVPIHSYNFDVRSGRRIEVPEATTAGATDPQSRAARS